MLLQNVHVLQKMQCLSYSRSITECVVCGGITEAYANLRKTLASQISKMANMSSEQCGKRAYVENGEVNSKCKGMNGFVLWVILYVEWTCETLYFLCNLKLRCIIMWSDLWLRLRTHSFWAIEDALVLLDESSQQNYVQNFTFL